MGEEYNKKIPLISEDIVKAFKIWEILKENTKVELKPKIPRKNNSIGEIWKQLLLKLNVNKNWFEQKFMNGLEIDKEKLEQALRLTNF